jgi:nucleoside-diphosphate-sugar epimerase
VRDPSKADVLRALGAKLVAGHVNDAAAIDAGLAGADIAFHLAAIYDVGVVDVAALERVNVEGTRTFLDALQRAGTPRAVYASTIAALGPVPEGEGDENSRYSGPYPSTYHRTKTEAHELALRAQAGGLPLVIVAPGNVYGPGDQGPNGRFLADVLAGRVPGMLRNPAWYSYVHVNDVVSGFIAAAERGETSGVYVLSGEHESVNGFAARAAKLAGRRPPPLRIPGPLAAATGAVLDVVTRLTGKRFPFSRESVAVGARDRFLHGYGRAARELGYAPRPISEGLPEMIEWLQRRRGSPRSAT